MLIFRQMFDTQSSTYTYLLADSESRVCVLIDPVFEQVHRDASFISELGLELLWTLDTHVHADHVTGAWLLKQRLGSRVALAAAGGAEGADRYLQHGDIVEFGARHLKVRATPGHTNGCLTYVLDDDTRAFTGDALLIRGCGRTDFQQGDARQLYHSIKEQIFSLPDNCQLWPAHDYRGATMTTVCEERRYNPRIGGELSESDFTGYLANLGLPHPKQIDIAVPANLRCGKPESGVAPAEPDWAPLSLTFGGIWEVAPQWLEEHADEVQIVDVREPDEVVGPLGHIAAAIRVPLAHLAEKAEEFSKEKPVVTVCRAGGRSAQATVILQRKGFEKVANLAGGMLRWNAGQHPTQGSFDYDAGL
ncbi:rhodanese-like domain-containing protein [Methylovirgula sp. HY1]|uniref:rhodanese-like domain-containing protein n=1 Tax=Methylovirgula sp. HY1 TaxID=2822761 RepID=UPI001C5B4FEE|nr:MBL fold metallo-hydrolase [Methylovirgula sp. HY1]QXX73429.1 putative metallo-hydrolase [Methylovirgula sp. HY1]